MLSAPGIVGKGWEREARRQFHVDVNTNFNTIHPLEKNRVCNEAEPFIVRKTRVLTSTQSPNNPRGRNEFNPWVMEATFHKKREASDSETPGENKKKIPKRETLPCLNGSTPCYLRHISRMRRTLHSYSRLPFLTSLLP